MSHFDEASKAGFALTYDQEKLANIRTNPSDRKIRPEKKFDPDVKMNENSEYEKYDFDTENNTMMEKVVINKFNSIVEKENEEDDNVETEKADILLNSDKFLKKSSKELNNNKASSQIPKQIENVNYADNQEDTEEEVFHKNDVTNKHHAKNNSNNPYLNIINESSNNPRKSPALKNNTDNYKSQLHTPINKTPEVKKKSNPNNKRMPTPNDFFINDDELVKKFNEIKQTNTFKKFVMKQENGSQVYQLLEKTELRNVVGYTKRNEFSESKKTPVKIRNTKTPSKTIDFEDISLNNNKKKGNINQEGNRIKALEDENVKLRNKVKVLEQAKSLTMAEDLEEEVKHLKEVLYEKNEELEQLQTKYEKKNRENIENKSKSDALQFDNELLQNKINDLKSKNESGDNSSLKTELKKKDEIIQKLTEENAMIKTQMESIRNESITSKTELNKKLEKINEQQQKIFQLEQENFEFKSRSNGESQAMKEIKQNYDNMKSNLLEIKNQNELINMKHQSLADENFSMKRDLIFLEKEIKNKSEIIDRLRNELLETNKKSYSNDYYTSNYNNENRHSLSNEKNNYNNNYSNVYSTNSKNSIDFNKKTIENNNLIDSKRGSNNNTALKSNNKKNYYNDSVTNNLNILPSQVNNIKYENRVLEIENKLMKVQKDRDQIQVEIEKMPEFPKTKVQILKKKNLEASIGEFNKEIAKLKLDLKDINQMLKD